MVLDHSLKALYTWFDRLADLPVADQERELQTLRSAGDPLAVQLEGMLLQHRRQDPTESPFSVDEILGACEDQNALRLAVDMRELSQRLRWDAKKHAFRLGQYLLRSCLSVSSLGATYQAHDEELERDVVVLLAFPRWNDEPLVLGRMLASARAVARIFHPGIATILGTVRIEGISAVVRQWIPGESLEVWAPARGGVSLQEIGFIGRGIARGLQVLHEGQVLHGDLKPANIIMRSGQLDPVITDFGTAFWLNSGEKNLWQGGTRGFVAPEILRNEPPSPQSDLYSLGVLLHWLTTGSLPGGEPQRILSAMEPEERDLELSLQSLIQELLVDDPRKRPACAALVAERLEAHLSERSHGGSRPLPWDRSRNRRSWLIHAAGLSAVAGISTWGGSLMAGQTQSQRRLFIPGTNASDTITIHWRDEAANDSLEFVPNTDRDANTRNSAPWLLVPTQVGRWAWAHSDRMQMPAERFEAGMFQFRIQFDCDPGEAWVRLDYQRDFDWTWTFLSQVRNFYGRRYHRVLQAAVPAALLHGTGSFRIRIGMMVRRAASFPTSLPPVALFSRPATDPSIIGDVQLWRDLHSPKPSVAPDQGSSR